MPRKKLAQPMTLKVVLEPDDDGGWHIYVPSLPGCRTWGRSLSEARSHIREAISLQEERLGDADAVARYAIFDEDIRLPPAVKAAVKRYAAAKAKAEAEAAKVKSASKQTARTLAEAKLSLRDAGELMGMSQEGVRKLLNTAKAHDAKTTPIDVRARTRARERLA